MSEPIDSAEIPSSVPAPQEEVKVPKPNCENCGHPYHLSVDGTSSCGICLNEYGRDLRKLEECCSSYSPSALPEEPKPQDAEHSAKYVAALDEYKSGTLSLNGFREAWALELFSHFGEVIPEDKARQWHPLFDNKWSPIGAAQHLRTVWMLKRWPVPSKPVSTPEPQDSRERFEHRWRIYTDGTEEVEAKKATAERFFYFGIKTAALSVPTSPVSSQPVSGTERARFDEWWVTQTWRPESEKPVAWDTWQARGHSSGAAAVSGATKGSSK